MICRKLFIAPGRECFAVGCNINSPDKAILIFDTWIEAQEFIWDYEAEVIRI